MGELAVRFVPQAQSKCFDGDGLLKRTGTVWTASAHIITAVIGSGVLSLAWAIAQLGWVAGPTVLFLFALITYSTSRFLATCYRSGDLETGRRNNRYMEAVQNNLGGFQVKICGFIQYFNLVGVAIGYTIAASISMIAVKRSSCSHEKGHDNPCGVSGTPYLVMFGVVEILFCQIPDFDQISWLSMVAAVMSFTYSSIGLGLVISKVAENGKVKGSLTGIRVRVTRTQKIWRSFQALGAIAFAYSHSFIHIEIQDKIKSSPAEHKTMKKINMTSVVARTIIYILWGCFGYAAFGDMTPKNLLSGFGNPYWFVDIAHAAIVIHHLVAYQVYCQPLFAFVENTAARYFPESKFINKNFTMPIPLVGYKPYKLNLFRLVWRTAFVCMTTIVSLLMPFFSHVLGIIWAFTFWQLIGYFPAAMYIVQKKIPRWSTRWVLLQILSLICLIISLCVAAGSFAELVIDL